MITAEAVQSLDQAGPEWDALFAAGPGVQASRAWFQASGAASVPEGVAPAYLLLRDGGAPAALIPMLAGPGQRLQSFTTPYTCLFQPLVAQGADPALVQRLGEAFGAYCRRAAVVRLEALDPDWAGLAPFLAGIRAAGMVPQRFAHFGNWHMGVAGWRWEDYLLSRPGKLRETIRRKTKAALRTPGVRLAVVRDPAGLAPALADYEAVYARSWKQAEPFPGFNGALVAAMAPLGVLRIGLMWVGDQPVAAQYWAVSGGQASVLKLAHDDAFKPLSPGTVLTAHVIRSLMEAGGVEELDFGRGDDEYKRDWAGARRQRIGVMLANPRSPAGALLLARQAAGPVWRRVQHRLASLTGPFRRE